MSKAVKLLAKALNNPNKEEATSAFSSAWSYAQREGVRLCDLHTITTEAAPLSPGRERELVDKYNKLLAEAKKLKLDVTYYRELYYSYQQEQSEAEQKLARLKKYIKRL